MKAIKLLLIVLICFFVSCIPWKKTVKTKEDVKITTNVELKIDSQAVEKKDIRSEKFTELELKKIEEKTDEFNSHLILYDTDKPVDEKTGRPPIKVELIQSKKSNNKAVEEKKKSDKEITIDRSKNKVDVKKAVTSKVKETKKIKVDERSGFNSVYVYLIVVIVVFGICLYFEFVKKISVFGKIKKLLFK